MLSRGEPLSNTLKAVVAYFYKTLKQIKNCIFLPVQKISMGQVCYKLPKIHTESDFLLFALENIVLQNFLVQYKILLYQSGTIIFSFFSNVETQVMSGYLREPIKENEDKV